MEYVYAAMILHKAGEDITEDNVTDVLEAAGMNVDENQVKSLIAALEDVDIDEAIDNAVINAGGGGAAPAPADDGDDEEDDEEEEEEEEEDEADDEEAAEGLDNLF